MDGGETNLCQDPSEMHETLSLSYNDYYKAQRRRICESVFVVVVVCASAITLRCGLDLHFCHKLVSAHNLDFCVKYTSCQVNQRETDTIPLPEVLSVDGKDQPWK